MTVFTENSSAAEYAAAPSRRRIVLADVAGFCFGVRRAVNMAQEARAAPGAITVLGPLVHNKQVMERLKGEGIHSAAVLEDVAGGTVVVSAHGVAPIVLQQARDRGLSVLDTTCPFVTRVHRSARMLADQGYQIILVGDPGHTEIKGVMGAIEETGASIALVSSPEEIAGLRLGKRVGVISQTTQRSETFALVVAEVCRTVSDVRALNTVCNATEELQKAATRLARQCDVVIVIGGRQSANTRRLRQLCEAEGVPAYHIETPGDLEMGWLERKEVVGLTAGASTPDWQIEDVARQINGGELPDDWSLHHPDE